MKKLLPLKINSLFLIYCLILLLPFILLYWMAPFVSDFTLSKDYPLHPITEQIELQFSLKTGSFPLYAPGYNLGHSSSALTLGQLYHPISHVASLLPGYWSGKALEWNTFLRFLTLGLTHLALFSFLRHIKLNVLFSFILSLITVYNLRMLEAFRYGASLEAFTGHLLLCAMIGRYFLKPSKLLGPLSIIGTTYYLVCSGHPPMMFYGLFGAGIFTLSIPFLLPAMFSDREVNIKNTLTFWTKIGLFLCLGIFLSSAYLVPFYFEFVSNNISYSKPVALFTEFVSNNFTYTEPVLVDPAETFAGALNNFFMPLGADLLGSFGGSSLIIIGLLTPLLRIFKVNIPYVIWFLWWILLYALFFILGPGTPVYVLTMKHLPFVSSLGGVGRIAMILPSVLMLLMAWIINIGAFSVRIRGMSVTLTPCSTLGLAALILTPVYLLFLLLLKPALGDFTPHFIRHIPFWIEILSVFFGMLSLALLVFYNMNSQLTRMTGIVLCIMVFLQVGTILTYGIWIQPKKDMPTFEQLKAQKRENLDYSFHPCPNSLHRIVLEHLSQSFMEPFLGKIFTQVIPAASQDEAYIKMQKERLPQQIFIEGFDWEKANKITESAKYMHSGKVELLYSSFNRLQFRVTSQAHAIFGLSYPYTGHWRAWVNGEKVQVYRGNGAAHAIEVPEGESLIEFRYWSNTSFWGFVLTCTAFTIIGLYVCFRSLRGSLRLICIVLVVVIGIGGFILWYNSLYAGDNLNTKYQWTYTPPQVPVNIAYGKKTSGYSIPSLSFLRWHSSNAVDEDIRPGSGLPLGVSNDKKVIVDLNKNEEIKSIVLYGEISTSPDISMSQDGIEWKMVDAVMSESGNKSSLRIIFENPQFERYIKVKASKGKLYIDELEVYKAL